MVECIPEIDNERHARAGGVCGRTPGFGLQSDDLLQTHIHVEVTRPDSRITFGSRRTIVDGRVAVIVEACDDVVRTVGICLQVGVDADIPECAQGHSRNETMTLIQWRASPFVAQIVIVLRQAEVSIGVVVVPAQGVITKGVQIPFVSQCLPEANCEVIGSRACAGFYLDNVACQGIWTNE